MNKLYKYSESFGRMGHLEGIFVATEEQVAEMMDRGACLDFGEALGKHSEVTGTVNEKTVTVVTDDQDFIAKADEYGLLPSGDGVLDAYEIWREHNPDDEDESEDDEDEEIDDRGNEP